MKKFVGFYYRCSFKVCLCAVLALIALTVLSSSAFAQCTQYNPCTYGDFTYMVSGGTVTITQYIGAGGDVVIPSTINGMPVVGIEGYYVIDEYGYWYFGAFEYSSRVASVTIPDSVTSIGRDAFNGCTSLTSVTIPNRVTTIGMRAFYNCSGLTSVTIPNSVTSIGSGAFDDCTSLTSIVVDASNTAYSSQDGVLYNKAKTVLIQYPDGKSGGFTIPDSVTSIGLYAFKDCSGLTSVTIGNRVMSIPSSSFFGCYNLTSVTIGNSVTGIGRNAFEYCISLTSVTIPNSVTSINDSAFAHCTGLTNVTIGYSVTSIGYYVFRYCSGLTKAYFLGNAPSMGTDVFGGCASNFSICYTAGATGFTTPTWNGYPASVCVPPTVINLSSFTATPKAGKVILQWSTEAETDNAGFNIYRAEIEDGEYAKINDSLISAQGSSIQGATYEFVDTDVKNRKTYYYKLEDIDLNGTLTIHGPVSATPRWFLGIFGIFKK